MNTKGNLKASIIQALTTFALGIVAVGLIFSTLSGIHFLFSNYPRCAFTLMGFFGFSAIVAFNYYL